MSTPRSVERILKAPGHHWVGDGFRVRGYFGAYPALVQRMSPFLLLDYGDPYDFPATKNTRRGVGPHPHRGFETVTVAFEGSVAHHDSAGNGGVIGPGDVQWMTAGGGLLHREYHAPSFAERGGTMHMAQIWVNLPKAHKLTPPHYQAITSDQIGRAPLPDGAGLVRVVAGEFAGVKGPARTFTKLDMLEVRLEPGRKVELSFPARQNTALLVMAGDVGLGPAAQAKAGENDFVLLANDGEDVTLTAQGPSSAQLLVLSGEPIDEPVVQYGPFVMNTRQEIEQAIGDFNAGKFGVLDD